MIELIKNKLKEEFFPYDKDTFDEKFLQHFSNYMTAKIYGKKVLIAFDDPFVIFFIQMKKELIILLANDLGYARSMRQFKNIFGNNIFTNSVTKVNIISSDKWLDENKELVNITSLISKNTDHIGEAYLRNKEDKLVDFNYYDLKSPVLWFLLKDINVVRKKYSRTATNSARTKNNFLPGLIKLILSQAKTESIFMKDIEPLKVELFYNIVVSMLHPKKIDILMEDLKSRNNHLLMPFITALTSNVSYNKEEWHNYFMAEFIPSFKDDLKNYIFDLSVAPQPDKTISKVMGLIYDRKESITNMDAYVSILNDLISFVEKNIDDSFFNGTYQKITKDKIKYTFKPDISEDVLFVKEPFNPEPPVQEDNIPF